MTLRRHIRYLRLLSGFLVAPAVVPLVSLFMLGATGGARHLDCGAGLSFLLGDIVHPGIMLSYLGAVFFGIPYVPWTS